MDENVIDLKIGSEEDGKMVFTHVGDKWRCGSYERRKADEDNKRMEAKQKAKDTL